MPRVYGGAPGVAEALVRVPPLEISRRVERLDGYAGVGTTDSIGVGVGHRPIVGAASQASTLASVRQ